MKISQTFDVDSNTTYKVTFWYSGNPDGGPATKTGTVQVVDQSDNGIIVGQSGNSLTFSSQNTSKTDLSWQSEVFYFKTGLSQIQATITFASSTPGQYGPVIADVNATAVPIPASVLLLGSGILGLGLLGWRRKSS